MNLNAKKINGVLIACLITVHSTVKAEGFRNYETADGRLISGAVLEYDADTEEVIFLRAEDRQLLQANLRAFSESERSFIRDWAVAKEFMEGLTISSQLHWRKNRSLSDKNKLVYYAWYEVLFNSTSGYPFGEVQVEYCIYYRQGKRRGRKILFDHGVCHGNGIVKLETVQQKDTLDTESILIYFLRGADTLFGAPNNVEGAMSGIWLQTKVLLPSGHACIREYRSSMEEDWTWTTQNVKVGLNADDE